ncbi:pyrimidine operon attenuation protein/uracil phosphoribosyltransferase [Breznakia blatticola]|uniref:Bifunctional protein PyrR n=2 Tax=Erysipelotrichaceae TaxID=128827 RepID=A0A4R7ZIQ0_9FIRM|nr:pyrimidine operon attenuation protein/uracil phosphoribosyltransferase [Breznakia sp. PH1-1]MDH6403124.1 pyrimidine operon attenuation protein/uracil phosphoribosyltransferase [Breznakia sp. PF1-11]MDH6410833.1 pyrimidine operon attenuation protein/uracil phosphoribosyltransferase [Breznakia sp. PFB1-11]MDH6413110.1 pyrimidine operon attenuation protein/uracil phosphoribosyltransferase [Breznakia sp. PFB1-14]MDH6415478.1 pyrimidine operon attenuation protein/uracil phosphoribosyltransferase 
MMKQVLDANGMRRSLIRITHEILEHNKGVDQIVLVGIETRGIDLAKRIQTNLETFENKKVECYGINVYPWRDDVKDEAKPEINLPINDKKVILVDDVLFKGRTVRAAMDALMANARPKEIQLAVLIDRGHRELPIRADYVGKNIPSSIDEIIRVKVEEQDGNDEVVIEK